MSFINTNTENGTFGESSLFSYILVGFTTIILAIVTVNEMDQIHSALLDPITNGHIKNTKQLLIGGKKMTNGVKTNNKTKRRNTNNNYFNSM